MNKIFSKLMLMAIAAMTFVACEEVPEPYDIPGTGTNIPGTSTEIEGGTVNVKNLETGEQKAFELSDISGILGSIA